MSFNGSLLIHGSSQKKMSPPWPNDPLKKILKGVLSMTIFDRVFCNRTPHSLPLTYRNKIPVEFILT
ncbi:hypothetical protein Hanom_Chr10g00896511 [Helianthus anomalus]